MRVCGQYSQNGLVCWCVVGVNEIGGVHCMTQSFESATFLGGGGGIRFALAATP